MTWLVLACFFFTGASGLVFEQVWVRELELVFGSTTLSISTVLAVFMGGLGLGSWLAGRMADRVKDRLRAYAIAEAGVGLYALLIPLILRFYPSVNAGLYRLFGSAPVALSLGRFLASALLLLIPTTLMGSTLPLLSRHFVAPGEKITSIGATVGSLYALNTLGAVWGTFAGGFILLPSFGVLTTNAIAAGANLVLAALVYLSRNRAKSDLDEPVLEPEPDSESVPAIFVATQHQRRLALWAFLVSGAAAMITQVLWTRALAIVLGSSVYSFTLILLAFLIGLSAGAAAVARLSAQSRNPVEWLAGVHLAVGATIGLSYLVMDKLPGGFLAILRGGSFSVDGIIFVQFMLAALAILPATLCMGGVFPLTVRIYASGAERVGRDVGTAYSFNTVGAILGSFAGGFVVLPVLGLQRGLALCLVSAIVLGGAFLLSARPPRKSLAAAVAVVACAALALTPRWSLVHFSAGLFRVSIAKEIIEADQWALPDLLYYNDGIATTVSVERWKKTVALKNNGKVDASNGDDMATQIMVGLMPLLFHPTALEKPPRVAVVGYGSGVTVGAVSQFPIARADVVELEPTVVEAGNRFFGENNHHPENNERVRILIGDGRNFLTQSDDKYDVIVSEPSNPWITGVSNLFTVDYWRLARARLAEDGVFCQWAQLYEMSSKNIKTILRSFAEVFPYTYVFSAEELSSDVILVAANHPLPLDLDRLARNFSDERLRAELKRGGIERAEDVVSYLLLTPEEIPAFTAGAPLNTDDNARIEFNAPRDLLGSTRTADPYLARVYASEWPYGRFDRFLVGLKPGDGELQLARSLVLHGRRASAERFVARALGHGASVEDPRVKLVRALGEKSLEDPEVPLTDSGDPLGLGGLEPPRLPAGATEKDAARIAEDHLAVERGMRSHAWAHALMALKKWPEKWIDEAGPDLELVVGYLMYKADLSDEAADRLRPLLEDEAWAAKRPALLYYIARAQYGAAVFGPAVRTMEKYIAVQQKDAAPQQK